MIQPSGQVTLQDLLRELANIRGLDFRGYKTNSLQRRLQKRMQQVDIKTYGDYLQYLHTNPGEITDLLQTVLINVTSFFRDPPAWEALRSQAFPIIFNRLRPGDTVRAWCAGCATGEEVYSLAILLAEHLGPSLTDYEVKIYATDHDEEALNVARRAEYNAERIRNLSPALREKYFTGGKVLRVNRDLRRVAIFGRSNLVSDAPISHVHLLLCRNVLIYFDLGLQRKVLRRFRYALEENGVLFLGKAESQLRESIDFRVINSKWRIFACAPGEKLTFRQHRSEEGTMEKSRQEAESLRTLQNNLLETLRQAVIVVDNDGVITTGNSAAFDVWGITNRENLNGQKLQSTILAERCPELNEYFQRPQVAGADPVQFQTSIRVNDQDRILSVSLKPILDDDRNRTGTLVYAEDVSSHEKLRTAIGELESTAEELHSANEELETTNEELQSTNEELETTNEELQSTNEELETTNEELHSLNEELETTNDELEMRTRELDEINRRYAETLEHMPSPVTLVGDDLKITLWNSAAQKLFGLEAKVAVGLELQHLPLPSTLRGALIRDVKAVLAKRRSSIFEFPSFHSGTFQGDLRVHLALVSNPSLNAVLVIFDAIAAPPSKSKSTSARKTNSNNSKPTRVAAEGTKTDKTKSKKNNSK